MAAPGLLSHRKFRRLHQQLAEPLPHVLGYLELMWNHCYDAGDEFLGDSDDVELACGWPGTPGKLVEALAAAGGGGRAGFIELCADGAGWQVHDLWEHAPQYVRRRRARAQERKRRAGQEDDDVEAQQELDLRATPERVAATDRSMAATDRSVAANSVVTGCPKGEVSRGQRSREETSEGNPEPMPPERGMGASGRRASSLPQEGKDPDPDAETSRRSSQASAIAAIALVFEAHGAAPPRLGREWDVMLARYDQRAGPGRGLAALLDDLRELGATKLHRGSRFVLGCLSGTLEQRGPGLEWTAHHPDHQVSDSVMAVAASLDSRSQRADAIADERRRLEDRRQALRRQAAELQATAGRPPPPCCDGSRIPTRSRRQRWPNDPRRFATAARRSCS